VTISLRPVDSADYEAIVACLQRNNMPGWSRHRWLAVWDEYPRRQDFQGIPRGSVLAAGGSIVDHISNVWAKYVLGDREVRVAVAGSAGVDMPEFARTTLTSRFFDLPTQCPLEHSA